MLLLYSVHFKSNRGELQSDIAKREEAARQLIAHASEMERLYSQKLALARRHVPKPRCIVGRSGHYPAAVGAKLRRIDSVFVLHWLASGLARFGMPQPRCAVI